MNRSSYKLLPSFHQRSPVQKLALLTLTLNQHLEPRHHCDKSSTVPFCQRSSGSTSRSSLGTMRFPGSKVRLDASMRRLRTIRRPIAIGAILGHLIPQNEHLFHVVKINHHGVFHVRWRIFSTMVCGFVVGFMYV